MSYTVKVQIREIGKLQIVGKNNTNKREFVCVEVKEEEHKYENILKFSLLKNAVAKLDKFKVGDVVEVYFDVKGREYNGKVYTDLNAWKIDEIATASDEESVGDSNGDKVEKQYGDDPLPF